MASPRVLVVGDVMVDRYVHCEVLGFSPEDDLVPKLKVLQTEDRPGGAANVARNMSSLEMAVTLVGVIGVDDDGKSLTRQLESEGIDTQFIVIAKRPTTVKTRYVTPRGRQAVRIDRECSDETGLLGVMYLENLLKTQKFDYIVVSDYAKGMITRGVVAVLTRDHRVIIDPKVSDYSVYGGAYAVTPNKLEYAIATLKGDHLPTHIIVTESEEGCSLLEVVRDSDDSVQVKPLAKVWTRKRDVGDPTGCGDSFLAGLVYALTFGLSLAEACKYGNAAGALAYDHRGVFVVTPEALKAELALPL